MDISLIPKEAFDLAKEVYGDLAKPSVKTAGEAINSTLKFVMLPFRCLGMAIDELEEKYKGFIANTLKKVDPERIQAPPPAIAGPIFEHLKYRFTEPDIIDMFSNLLAASMDTDTSKSVHPSYVYILQQMSVLEAKLLEFIFNNPNSSGDHWGMASKKTIHSSKLGNDYDCYCAIFNLKRLGIIREECDGKKYEKCMSDKMKSSSESQELLKIECFDEATHCIICNAEFAEACFGRRMFNI